MDSDLVAVADSRTRMQAFVHGIGVIVAAFVIANVFVLAAALVINPFVPITTPGGDLTQTGAVISFIIQFSGFILTVWAYVRWRDGPRLFELGTPSLRDIGMIAGGLLALIAVSSVMSIIVQALGYQSATNTVVRLGNENPRLFLYMIPISLLLVGPGEELLFRGVVQGLFRQAYGPIPAVLLAGGTFGLVHYVALAGQGKIVYVGVAAVLGIVLGTLYELSGNIIVPAIVHGCWNSVLFLGQWIAATQDVQVATVTLL